MVAFWQSPRHRPSTTSAHTHTTPCSLTPTHTHTHTLTQWHMKISPCVPSAQTSIIFPADIDSKREPLSLLLYWLKLFIIYIYMLCPIRIYSRTLPQSANFTTNTPRRQVPQQNAAVIIYPPFLVASGAAPYSFDDVISSFFFLFFRWDVVEVFWDFFGGF